MNVADVEDGVNALEKGSGETAGRSNNMTGWTCTLYDRMALYII